MKNPTTETIEINQYTNTKKWEITNFDFSFTKKYYDTPKSSSYRNISGNGCFEKLRPNLRGYAIFFASGGAIVSQKKLNHIVYRVNNN